MQRDGGRGDVKNIIKLKKKCSGSNALAENINGVRGNP
jgi:hypothetical protein